MGQRGRAEADPQLAQRRPARQHPDRRTDEHQFKPDEPLDALAAAWVVPPRQDPEPLRLPLWRHPRRSAGLIGSVRRVAEHRHLALDDAELYYEIRGSGPVLLIVQGGAGDAGTTDGLAAELAGRFRVLTYDRRGIARSSSGDGPVTVSRHADDAARLLDQVCSGPALVYGVSIGALIGLHLAVESPGRVSTLVAHEPPMSSVVLDAEREHGMDQIETVFRRDGPVPAMRAMATLVGATPETMEFEDGVRPAPPAGDVVANFQRFFTHDLPAVRSSALTAAAVAATLGTLTIPTGGVLSRGRWEYRCADVLSTALGRPLTEMPGGHNGSVTHPRATATALQELLAPT